MHTSTEAGPSAPQPTAAQRPDIKPSASQPLDPSATEPLAYESGLVTWNVNSLPACVRRMGHRSLKDLLESFGPHISLVCVQETKMQRKDLDMSFCKPEGWDAFYSFAGTKQYSGVATFCRSDRARPIAAEEGFVHHCCVSQVEELLATGIPDEKRSVEFSKSHGGWAVQEQYHQALRDTTLEELQALDTEGRCVMTDHGDFVLYNVYFPAMRMADKFSEELDEDRLLFKYRFNLFFYQAVKAQRARGRRVVVVGDVNIALDIIDTCDPCADFYKSNNRLWFNMLLNDCRMVDLFRVYHPGRKEAYTCWNSQTGAKLTNYGSRIDYILVDEGLVAQNTSPRAAKQSGQDIWESWAVHSGSTLNPSCCTFTRCDVDGHDGKFAKGSDHGAVIAWISNPQLPTAVHHTSTQIDTLPSLCAALWPEAKRRQEDIRSMFLGSKVACGASDVEGGETSQSSADTVITGHGKKVLCPSEIASSQGDCTETAPGGSQEVHARSIKRDMEATRNSPAAEEAGRKKAKLAGPKQSSLSSFFGAPAGPPAKKLAQAVSGATTKAKPGPPLNEAPVVDNKEAATAWNQILRREPSHTGKPVAKKNVKAPSYLSDKEQKAFLATVDFAPLCSGHNEPSVQRIVQKGGPNQGRKFWVCARPNGAVGHEKARCNFFQWDSDSK